MIAYKVVEARGNDFLSCRIEYGYELTYSLGICTNKVEGRLGICCFDTPENARAFALPSEIILLVEGTGLRRYRYLCHATSDMDKFYHQRHQKKGIKDISMTPPDGTIFFDSIVPIEVIYEGNIQT